MVSRQGSPSPEQAGLKPTRHRVSVLGIKAAALPSVCLPCVWGETGGNHFGPATPRQLPQPWAQCPGRRPLEQVLVRGESSPP